MLFDRALMMTPMVRIVVSCVYNCWFHRAPMMTWMVRIVCQLCVFCYLTGPWWWFRWSGLLSVVYVSLISQRPDDDSDGQDCYQLYMYHWFHRAPMMTLMVRIVAGPPKLAHVAVTKTRNPQASPRLAEALESLCHKFGDTFCLRHA